MTYLQLANEISKMTDEQVACDVTVYVGGQDEYYPVDEIVINNDTDVLDENHPVIVIDK